MTCFVRTAVLTLTLAISGAATANAQLFYVGVRGGAAVPTGRFSETGETNPLLTGAKAGFGYGLDIGTGAGLVGFYAGYDRIKFDCDDSACATAGKYDLTGYSAGVRVGVPLLPVKPWAKAGITLNEMKGTFEGSSESRAKTKRNPGYEIGAGVDIPVLAGFFSLTPQARYIRQNLEATVSPSGATSGGKRPVNYYTFDIGLRVKSPI
jgi:opacity protein-like surface antigen